MSSFSTMHCSIVSTTSDPRNYTKEAALSAVNAKDGSVTDWRGTPITEGALVIYGAPVGRSIAMVEAEVVGFTKSGRVNVRVLRRAYGGGYYDMKEIVHVGADRLTIVEKLPPTDLPLESEKSANARAAREARYKIEDSHSFPNPDYRNGITYGTMVCAGCRLGWAEAMKGTCTA